jgi:tight adherence protein C
MVGAAVFAFAWWIVRILATDDLQQGSEWRYDVSRINELRRADLFFKLFQPVIQSFAKFNRVAFSRNMNEAKREIQAAGLSRGWLPEEYFGKLQLIALMISPVIFFGFFSLMGLPGIPVAVIVTLLLMLLFRRYLSYQAKTRLTAIKRRLPFMLDLMTLLMEAGTTFLHALEQAVDEYRGHPLSKEFSRVLTDMSLGKTRQEALEAMRDRLQDDEITSILGSIIQSENLGTPLTGVLRTQADVLRIKRSQRAEAIAGEAGVKMLLPGILVMAATVIVIIGPFAINFLLFGFNLR